MEIRKIRAILILAGVLLICPAAFGQERSQGEASSKKEKNLTLARMVAAAGVESREPLGAAERFSAQTERVYCFIEARDISEDVELTLRWYAGDKPVGEILLPLKQGAKWRTWAYKNLHGRKGDWKVEAATPDGKILKEIFFRVE
jgi:hypothetical protein